MARHAAGRPNIMTGKKPADEGACGRIAGEKAVQVAEHAVIIAHDEIDEIVQDVVQAHDDQQPVENAEDRNGPSRPCASTVRLAASMA